MFVLGLPIYRVIDHQQSGSNKGNLGGDALGEGHYRSNPKESRGDWPLS